MKILQISSTFFPVNGGQEKVVYEISKRLVKRGHKVDILTTDMLCTGKVKEKERKDGVNIIRIKNNFYLGGYGFSEEAKKWLEDNRENYDVAHSHGYNRFLSEFSIWALRNKLPTIFTPHGFIHTKKNYLFKIIHDLTVGRLIKNATQLTALTKLDFENYKKLGVEKEKITEVPNGVDIKKFSKITRKGVSKFKKKYGLLKTVLFVGRIHESKGIQYLIEAIKDIDCKLMIIGEDVGYKKELEKKIKNLNLEKKVIFTGHLEEKEKITAYKACDIFVLFSEWEGFGITVIEAMAAGKPVIVSNRGSLPFLVKDKKEGFVIPFKNVNILRGKIKFLLGKNKIAGKMGKSGAEEVKKYDWESVVSRYLEVYKKAQRNRNE
ncbi:MAG: glycosyltransferase family 4 protein [Candidatus Pacearchaeota archaeon]|nr:glycosyltransferase family 4 protein [Candidatus Pacearchaeota archaeon]